jgi:hypothetical protein
MPASGLSRVSEMFFHLADRARFGDPMAHLVRQKEAAPPPPVIPERMVEQMKKSGFVVPQASTLSTQIPHLAFKVWQRFMST